MSHVIAGRMVPLLFMSPVFALQVEATPRILGSCLCALALVRNSAAAAEATFQNWLNQFQTSWYCQLPLDWPGSRGSGV